MTATSDDTTAWPVDPGPVELAGVELDWTPVFAADIAGRDNAEIDALTVRCPICDARPGQPCEEVVSGWICAAHGAARLPRHALSVEVTR